VTRLARSHRRNGESLREWSEAIARSRPVDRPMGHAADEIHDPVGESIEVYRSTASVLDRLLGELATALVTEQR
jgi:protein-tyrosine-phosphatase